MKRLAVGLVVVCLCCTVLVGCGEANALSVTLYGRVVEIENSCITLKPGMWENEQFIEDEGLPTVTVKVEQGLFSRWEDENNMALTDMPVGSVVHFTVSAAMNSEEQITHLELVKYP